MQEIIKGFDSEKFSELLKKNGVEKFFLICGKSFDSLCIREGIEKCGIAFTRFSDFTPNPDYDDIANAVELFGKEDCNGIVAVGGGSAIDIAKCVKAYSTMDSEISYLEQEIGDTGLFFCSIPTTAGTGSESTQNAVIYKNKIKKGVSHYSLLPHVVFLEPKVLLTLPMYQKKCTLLDALCQGIESYWSVASTEESSEYAEKAIRLTLENAGAYLFENSPFAAAKILEAANYSGKAINISKTTAPHAMSYRLTMMYGLPHGHAVAVSLLRVWKHLNSHIEGCTDCRGKQHLTDVLNNLAEMFGAEDIEDAVNIYEGMLASLGIRCPETDNADDIDSLTDAVDINRLKNTPVAVEREDIKKMYLDIVKVK